MVRGPTKFTLRDLTRTLKAAKTADVPVKIEIKDGRMTVIPAITDKNSTTESERGCASATALRAPRFFGRGLGKVRRAKRKCANVACE
jgi:hypothetical protein